MHDIQLGIDPVIQRLTLCYYAFGIWRENNDSKLQKYFRVPFFWLSVISYPLTLVGGAWISKDLLNATFLFTLGTMVAVIEFKGFYVFFKKDDILNLIKTTCTQSVPNNERLLRKIKKKLYISQKCSQVFILLAVVIALNITVQSSPLFFHNLPYTILFPWDYKKSRAAHWLAHSFLTLSEVFVVLNICLSTIMWCILINCSVTYDILGYRLKSIGSLSKLDNQIISGAKNLSPRSNNKTILTETNLDFFMIELTKCIRIHKILQGNVSRTADFFSALLFVQIGTSAFGICGAVYLIATDSSSELYYMCVGLLIYAILDIFILTYYGNEIKVSSSKLLYCLFESNWMEQSQISKSSILILGEVLKRQQVIMVAKLYPLSLETFISIMRGAYSMFNILNSTSARQP